MAPFRASVKHIVSTYTHTSENLWEGRKEGGREGDAFTTHLLLESLALKSAERRRRHRSASFFQREQPLRELGHAVTTTTMRMSDGRLQDKFAGREKSLGEFSPHLMQSGGRVRIQQAEIAEKRTFLTLILQATFEFFDVIASILRPLLNFTTLFNRFLSEAQIMSKNLQFLLRLRSSPSTVFSR